MASENETVEAVLKEMRDIFALTGIDKSKSHLMVFLDRIEAAWRLERKHRRNCDRFANRDEAFAGYVDTFTEDERDDFEHGRGDFDDFYNVQERFIEWLFAPVAEGGES